MSKKQPTKRTPVKRNTANKAPACKKSATPRRVSKNNSKRGGWGKILWGLTWKLGLAAAAVLLLVGLYLYSLVERRFEGQLFDLPTIVYARVLTLSPGMQMSNKELRTELDALNYRKVEYPRFPGEYAASSSKVELIRRPFEFEDGPEPDRHVMVHFSGGELSRIYSMERQAELGFLRLEPKMLGMLEKNVEQHRLFVPRDETPEFLIDALLTTEDRDFYQHDGVSPTAILRAFAVNVKAGKTVQGGSTLTQQLSKNLFLSSERTLWRKVREAYIAVMIDYLYDKDRILEGYLNEVYLGQSGRQAIHGFGLAARYYFGAPLQELRIDQQALLVGMVKGPSYYNPLRHPERVKQRRDLILRLMMEQGYLTGNQYQVAVSRDIDLQANPRIAPRQPAYFELLKQELKQKVGENYHEFVGLRLFTSLDPVSQNSLVSAITGTIPNLEKRSGADLEAAGVAVDRVTGEVRAMVGGKRTGYEGYNRALNASRPIGSLAKPAVYLTAWKKPNRYQLITPIIDSPISLKGSNGTVWEPRNYDRVFRGAVPMYQGLTHSLNVPTVKIGMKVGIKEVTQTLIDLGIDSQEIRSVPSMFLGAFSLTPYEVTQMYQTITNSGRRSPLSSLRVVMDEEGEVLYKSLPRAKQQVPEQAAWLTTYVLKKTVTEGTARSLSGYSKHGLAGKTGTTNDGRDSWFVGADGREVTTIWVGRDDNGKTSLTGSSGALPIYKSYIEQRSPKTLQLSWPQNLITLGYQWNDSGTVQWKCGSSVKTPVWDPNGVFKKVCDKSMLQKLVDW
ncbi:peptidase [Vibrio sp. qd031]|uniref:penicillin-binding protein 1B n=1 Tax=Vibrio sp. qd031 TaxID=1603038 RepID=UPI000A106C47|nr:penicillin-binding protein 1B [Vibrio sp. qd031]ORT48882.1 peptidase [Vibrio sp. qd031]